VGTFILGIIGYSVLTAVLWSVAVATFNETAGRGAGQWKKPPRASKS
jgi:hypothetical protein